MTAVKKTQTKTKRDLKANRRTKSVRKSHKRISFQRTGDGGPGSPTDGTGSK